MSEIWKAIPGFEGAYEVSNLGRVRSLDRVVESPTAKRGLRRDTHVGNVADRLAHGTHTRGEQNGAAKLDVAAVLDIRAGGDRHALAAQYGVGANHITRIRAKGRWAHV